MLLCKVLIKKLPQPTGAGYRKFPECEPSEAVKFCYISAFGIVKQKLKNGCVSKEFEGNKVDSLGLGLGNPFLHGQF